MLHFVQISRIRGSAYNVSLAFWPPECQILKRLGRSNSCSYVSRKNCLCIRRKLLCMNKQVLYGYYISQILKQNIFYSLHSSFFTQKHLYLEWNTKYLSTFALQRDSRGICFQNAKALSVSQSDLERPQKHTAERGRFLTAGL